MHMHIWSRAPWTPPPPLPQMVWEAPSLVWVVVGFVGTPPPFLGVGSCGWESPSLLPPLWCGVWWVLPPLCGVGFGGVEFVLGSLGEVESVVVPDLGLLVVVKLLYYAKPYSVGEDFVVRLWDVRLGVSADLGDSC